MTGTASRIEWAKQIKPRVNAEFDRVAKALMAAASNRGEQVRMDTQAVMAILEEKRAEVMARDQAYGQETRRRVMTSTNFDVDVWTRRDATLRGHRDRPYLQHQTKTEAGTAH
jgi:hypothetical protein